MHDELWDERVGLVRLAPGVTPGVDLSALDLHAVRESALGAFLDLADGRVARAERALWAVLDHQYDEPGTAWDGTFKVTAEEGDPPAAGAAEWLHYDPNWRQFLGCILTLTVVTHGEALADDLVAAIHRAVDRCVAGEPADRIPRWYTNPNLMHAWLTATVGARRGDPALLAAGIARARLIVDRLDRYGDVDEYNSPTYDGIDLFAASLWVALPPDETFGPWGRRLVDRLSWRMSELFHPALHAVCGPYIRAYGLSLQRYVSLAGLWLGAAAVDDTCLPPMLDARTAHVHDLYFLPVFAHLRALVDPPLEARPVAATRRLVQTFGPVRATSILAPDHCLGFESGRALAFARDQYVPVAVFAAGDYGTDFLALMPGDATTAVEVEEAGEGSLVVTVTGSGAATEVVVVCSGDPTIAPDAVAVGRLRLLVGGVPHAESLAPTPDHWGVRLRWPAPEATASLVVGPAL